MKKFNLCLTCCGDMEKKEETEREDFRSVIQSYIRMYGYISQVSTFTDLGLENFHL